MQPEVVNTESMSVEELPAPILAESPTDVELVTEEELTLNKSKRKIESMNDISEVNDTPTKKSRPDIGELSIVNRKLFGLSENSMSAKFMV